MQRIFINNLFKTIFIISFFIISLSAPSMLMGADSEPERVLKSGVDDMTAVLNDPAFADEAQKKARKDILFNKADSIFDFSEFSKGALGKNWERFSESQRTEFTKAFSRLIANTYLAKIDDENFQDLKITYLKTEILAPTKSGIERADIASDVLHNKVVTPVYYRMMKKKGGSWKIYDVKIEGVSLVGNYREQYRTRFNDSPDKIIEEIKEKIK
ncbi:MAG: ABC transporter substrate-binding protein [Desulfamplus sp.]|nr:ABC transporter substrate-binding protein [Desulfamplus sp.]MBF0411122.1 ABC transporter substrate-binding protein [Desulfamplus sp.]